MIKQEICKQTNEKVMGWKTPTKITAALMAFLFFLTHKQKNTVCGIRLLVHKDAKYCVPCCCSLAAGWPGMMLLLLLLW